MCSEYRTTFLCSHLKWQFFSFVLTSIPNLLKRTLTLLGLFILLFYQPLQGQLSEEVRDSLWNSWLDEGIIDSSRMESLHAFIEKGFMYTQPDSARALTYLLEHHAINTESQQFVGKALMTRGITWAIQGKYDSCYTYFTQALNHFESTGLKKGSIRASFNLGNLFMIKGDTLTALSYYKKSEDLSKLIDDPGGMAQAAYVQSELFSNRGDLDSAIIKISEAQEYFLKAGDVRNACKAVSSKGDFTRVKGNYDEAARLYNSGSKLALENKILDTYATLQAQLAYLYLSIDENNEAEIASRNSVRILDSLKNAFPLYNARITLGGSLLKQGKFDEALEVLSANLDLAKEMNDPESKAKSYAQLAEYYSYTQNFNSVQIYADSALSVVKSSKIKDEYFDAHKHLAAAYLDQGRLALAEKEINKSLEITTQLNNKKQSQLGYELLAEILNSSGKYSEAYLALDQAFQLKEELVSDESQRAVIKAKFKSDYDQQNLRDSLEFVFKEEKLQAENTAQKRISTIAIIGLIALGLLALFLFKSRKTIAQQKEKISKSLDEKDTLLREIHHRVKNNLQVVSSLLRLQTRATDDDKAKDALNEGQTRVESMSLIHQNLYQKENLTGIRMKDYLEKLSKNLFNTYKVANDEVKLQLNIADLNLDVDTVVPLGLIINELITNSLKYAFPNGSAGELTVNLSENEGVLHLIVRDTGVGFPAEELEKRKKDSFGFTLIQTFTKKLKADLNLRNENGAVVDLKIKNYNILD